MNDTEKNELRERIIAAIRTVKDPEIPVNLYDLGLIYNIDVHDDAAVKITMTLTTPNCPVAELLPQSVQTKVGEVDGVSDVQIELAWEPAWKPDMMSEDAKLALDYDGSPGAFAALKKDPFTSLSVGKTQRPRG